MECYWAVEKEYIPHAWALKKNITLWNKPDTKGQMLYDSNFKNESRTGKFTGSRLEVSRDWGEGEKGKLLFKRGREFLFGMMNIFWNSGWWWLHNSVNVIFTLLAFHKPLQCSCLESPRDGRAWWAMGSHRVRHDWSDLAAAVAPAAFHSLRAAS